MKHYEKLYLLKDNPKFVKKYLEDLLLFRIYSVPVIRRCYAKWPELYPFIRENTPSEVVALIDKSPHFSDRKVQKKIESIPH